MSKESPTMTSPKMIKLDIATLERAYAGTG